MKRFTLLRNSRKTECGAKQFLVCLEVGAAPFALPTESPTTKARASLLLRSEARPRLCGLLGAFAVVTIWIGGAVNGIAQETNATTTTVTAATGTITHLNYGGDGEVQGFLIGTNILLSFPTNICGGLSTLGVVGNSVTYSGTAFTATSGFQAVQVTSFTNNTAKTTYTAPTSNSTTYGPTSGTVKQLNYASDGSIDGFVFTATAGTASIFVSVGERASTVLTPLLTLGAAVSVTGQTSADMSACSSTATLEAVNASSLTIGSQTIVISGGGNGGGVARAMVAAIVAPAETAALSEESAQNGVRRKAVPNSPTGARRTLCAFEEFAQNGVRSKAVPNSPTERAAPFALLKNSRETECGAKQFLIRPEVRAPFALLRNLSGTTEHVAAGYIGFLALARAATALCRS